MLRALADYESINRCSITHGRLGFRTGPNLRPLRLCICVPKLTLMRRLAAVTMQPLLDPVPSVLPWQKMIDGLKELYYTNTFCYM